MSDGNGMTMCCGHKESLPKPHRVRSTHGKRDDMAMDILRVGKGQGQALLLISNRHLRHGHGWKKKQSQQELF